MEEILKDISTNYIKLAEDKEHDNNVILHSSLRIIEYMKRQDPLFKAIFDRVFFGGSYHDRLNIGKPNKFKLDLLFDIEEFCDYDLPSSKIPGFIHLEVIEFTGEREERATVRQFRKLFDDRKYLCTGKVLGWMENVLRGAFEELKYVIGRAFLETIKGDFKITFTRKASALRLLIHTADGSDYYDEDDDEDDDKTEVMSIDLVPCFVFNGTMWPRDIRYNNVPEKDEFFIVPEIPTAGIDQPLERYWRLSFQEQERVLINDKGNLKPTIKLLEKLRDKYKDDYITSYYIKTMFLHIVEREPDFYWNYPLSCLFMDALKELKKYIESRKIPQYWYKGKYNLTSLGDRQTLANRLECMIKDIENTPRAVAKYLLKPQAYEKFMRESVVVRVQLNLTNMENVLQEINRKFISLPDDEVRRNNRILESILGTFIDKMKTEDPLFNVMFRRVFYGGSYYDGLRVGKPEEFDLDLLLQLPVYAKPVLTVSNIPGFVHLQLENFDGFMKQPEAKNYRNFKKLFDEELNHLTTVRTLAWMEGLVQRSLNKFPFMGGVYLLRSEVGCFDVKVRKGGPALTLQIRGMGMKMDVDLVACFVFGKDMWPADGFSSNPFPGTLPEFFIVPKPLRDPENKLMPLHWRLSFQEQERKLIDNKNRLKPTIKLLKKLRDNLQHTCIASYHIKTVLLHIISLKDDSFWNRPLSQVFIIILREYKDFITDGLIRYYWNSKNNLIGEIKEETLQIMSQRLSFIIQDIENNRDIPTTVAKHLLTRDEYRAFVEGTAKDLTTADPPTPNESSSCLIA